MTGGGRQDRPVGFENSNFKNEACEGRIFDKKVQQRKVEVKLETALNNGHYWFKTYTVIRSGLIKKLKTKIIIIILILITNY